MGNEGSRFGFKSGRNRSDFTCNGCVLQPTPSLRAAKELRASNGVAIVLDYEAGKEHVPFPSFPLCSPASVLRNHLTASLAFYRVSITGLRRACGSRPPHPPLPSSPRMAWPTSHCECGFNPAEWTESRLRLQRRSRRIGSSFLFVSHKMRGGGCLLAHQAGPGVLGLPSIPGDPESGEEGGLNGDLRSAFYRLRAMMMRESEGSLNSLFYAFIIL